MLNIKVILFSMYVYIFLIEVCSANNSSTHSADHSTNHSAIDDNYNVNYAVRMCARLDMEKNQTVMFCIGVYFHRYYALSNGQCSLYFGGVEELILYMGGDHLDCFTGYRSAVDRWYIHTREVNSDVITVAVLRLAEDFPNVHECSMVELVNKLPELSEQCHIYCSYRILSIHGKEGISGQENCTDNIKATEINITKCMDKMQIPHICSDYKLESSQFYTNSPLICKDKVFGFLKPLLNVELDFVPTQYFLEDIIHSLTSISSTYHSNLVYVLLILVPMFVRNVIFYINQY